MLRLASSLLLILLIPQAQVLSQETIPFKVENPRSLTFPPKLASRIFYMALRNVATDVNPSHPSTTAINLTLHLGDDKDSIEDDGSLVIIHMKKWDKVRFAYGCVWAATRRIVTKQRMIEITRFTDAEASATVDISEIKQ